MTDRELLGWAAKAAGLEFKWRDGDLAWGPEHVGPAAWINECWQPWNPITDDGDALRLDCALRINVEHMKTLAGDTFGINCWPSGRGDCGASEDGDLTDYVGATRRAIVRAAAEIGRASTGEKP